MSLESVAVAASRPSFSIARARTAGEAVSALGIPTGTVRTVGAAIHLPEAVARGMVSTVSHPAVGDLKLVSSPIRMSGTPVVRSSPPPLLGQLTEEVLIELLGRRC